MKVIQTKEYISTAELAINNGQFETALSWLKKVLSVSPNDLYALSRAGAVCVQTKRYEEALEYLTKAVELDPKNGDNYFNLGNAYLFQDNHAKAFENYVEAERIGCSEDVKPQLNYYLMLICGARQDIKSALTYLKKCEHLDNNKQLLLNAGFISEKVKLYLLAKDYEEAERAAAQLVAIEPASYRGRSVYYSLLMANDRFDVALRVLDETETYCELSADDMVTLAVQKSALYLILAENTEGSKEELYGRSIDVLQQKLADPALTSPQRNLLSVTLADLYYKFEKYDEAISLTESVLPDTEFVIPDVVEATGGEDSSENREHHRARPSVVHVRPSERNHSPRHGASRVKADTSIAEDIEIDEPLLHDEDVAEEGQVSLTTEQLDKLYFVLTSCYMAKEDYEKAGTYAELLKHSDNKYYSYFGLYAETLVSKFTSDSISEIENNYAKAIAFFKNKTATDYKDSMAMLFRIRLYAESGKYEKASELASVLAKEDYVSAMNYIQEWKQKNQ